jgi:two-component system C4-dicarboxylate transport sensor histidine kinase DctB
MDHETTTPVPAATRLWRSRALLALVAALTISAATVYLAVDDYGRKVTERTAEARLSLTGDTLRDTIDRFVGIPELAGASRQVTELLARPDDAGLRDLANRFLERTATEVGLAALFVVDRSGTALAASNWRESTSFVGHGYAFRSYFTDALAKGRGRLFGVGVTTGLPGYFLTSRIGPADAAAGVVVAKVDFAPLEASWSAGGERVMVSDGDNVVFLATEASLRYRPLGKLTAAGAAAIAAEQRYATHAIGPPITPAQMGSGAVASRPVDGTPWHITVVVPWLGRGWQPATAAALTFLAGIVVALAFIVRSQRRARVIAERESKAALERRVAERTADLALALQRLEAEIAERRRVDADLHRARDELVQAAKLAAMGRAFSGLAHEVNQPLAALRTYLSSTRLLIARGDHAEAIRNIAVMDGAVERVTTLTSELKRLARRSDDNRAEIDLAVVARRVADLLRFRFADAGARLALEVASEVRIHGDSTRLEQVVLNLLLNAIDAVASQDERSITLTVDVEDGQAHLVVADRGPGVADEDRARLFEPFFTTKEVGVGLGLGLAISYAIIRDHGGTIRYERSPSGETRFHVHLPLLARGTGEIAA